MSRNHAVSDLVASLRNGYLSKKSFISVPYCKLVQAIIDILKNEGYISSYSIASDERNIKTFNISLKYHNSSPALSEIDVISKPGKRMYSRYNEISHVKNGLGVMVLTTSKGIMTDHDARLNKVGGELLLKLF